MWWIIAGSIILILVIVNLLREFFNHIDGFHLDLHSISCKLSDIAEELERSRREKSRLDE
jgi:hypothetical protein